MNAKAHEVEVHVKSLKTNAKTEFKIVETATLDEVWTESGSAGRLNEPRAAGDTFRCQDGTDLSNRLGDSLETLLAEDVCRNRHFEIRGDSGGA
ncbi:MAG: hypothetical protein H0U52_07370 [Chloroflexi bacterium]|nr:hypothetical protein [Chloroflexota bacterium]